MPSILNSPRGHNAFRKLTVADSSGNEVEITCNSTSLVLDDGLLLSDGTNTVDIGADANGMTVAGKLTLNSANSGLYLSANTTGYIPEAQDAVPDTNTDALLTFVSNSTGNYVCINQTGSTWYYLNVTTDAPTVGG
jgi:hypothetical protein